MFSVPKRHWLGDIDVMGKKGELIFIDRPFWSIVTYVWYDTYMDVWYSNRTVLSPSWSVLCPLVHFRVGVGPQEQSDMSVNCRPRAHRSGPPLSVHYFTSPNSKIHDLFGLTSVGFFFLYELSKLTRNIYVLLRCYRVAT